MDRIGSDRLEEGRVNMNRRNFLSTLLAACGAAAVAPVAFVRGLRVSARAVTGRAGGVESVAAPVPLMSEVFPSSDPMKGWWLDRGVTSVRVDGDPWVRVGRATLHAFGPTEAIAVEEARACLAAHFGAVTVDSIGPVEWKRGPGLNDRCEVEVCFRYPNAKPLVRLS